MKLFTKADDKKLFEQYSKGSNMSNQKVIVKIFNPYGNGTWFIMNSDPNDPDYLWGIVDLGYGAEVGSISRSDLENYRNRFGLGFEKDSSFSPINAKELYSGLRNGEFYEDGGAFGNVAFIVTNDYFGNIELGFYNVSINEQYTSYKAFMKYSDALDSLLKFLNSEDGEYMVKNNPKSKFEIEMVFYNPKLDKYKDFEPQRKVVFSLKASMVKHFLNKRIFEDGGQLEMKFARGGKVDAKIQKKVEEINAMIEKAFDLDGDPLWVIDTSSTWQEPVVYKPIIYRNGRLYIEYFEPYSGKTVKETILKRNMEEDGYGTLLEIAKMYRRALKKKSNEFKNGGKVSFKEKSTAIAKKFVGKKVEPKYQKEYGKVYNKAEAKEVGNKIAGSQKANYDSKMASGGKIDKNIKIIPLDVIRNNNNLKAEANRGFYIPIFNNGEKIAFGFIETPESVLEDGMAMSNVKAVRYKNGEIKIVYGKTYYNKGGKTNNRGNVMQIAKQIRKEGESWQSALKRASMKKE